MGARGAGWVVSGFGAVSAAGCTPADLVAAASAARPETLAGGGSARGPAIPIEGFDLKRFIERKGLRDLSRTSRLACAAASPLARELAGLAPDSVGVVFGTAWASLDTVVAFERRAHLDGPRFVDPLLFTETVANVPAGQLSIVFGWSGFNATVASGAAAGLEAIALALELLEQGRATVAVAGGGDELNHGLLLAPEEAGLAGDLAGEGAALVTLESPASAGRRGVEPAARVAAAEAIWLADGAPGAAGWLTRFVDRGGLAPEAIGAIALAGPGGGRRFAAPVAALVGRRRVPLLTLGAALGQTWAASGPFALALALEALAGRYPDVPAAGHALVLAESGRGHVAGVLLGAVEGRDGR